MFISVINAIKLLFNRIHEKISVLVLYEKIKNNVRSLLENGQAYPYANPLMNLKFEDIQLQCGDRSLTWLSNAYY